MTTNGYEKYHRLLKACDFSFLKLESKMLSAPWIRVFYCPSRLKKEDTRIGFSVTKKVGKAHDRNRLKRLLKEAFRQSPYKHLGLDALFVVPPNLLKKIEDQQTAERYLRESFNKLLVALEKDNAL